MIRRWALVLTLVLAATPAGAQTVPDIQLDNPRVQTAQWQDGLEFLLTVMPNSGLTVMLGRDEVIERVTLDDTAAYIVRVSPEGNSLLVLANPGAGEARMQVATDRRTYPLALRTGTGLTAAYLVRFTYAGELDPAPSTAAPAVVGQHWSYRLRGDATVQPQRLSDDAVRTYIAYGPDQPLPAVFAIGPAGEEELVNGYMREDVFVIDRVYAELVFRLDDARATARRNPQPEG